MIQAKAYAAQSPGANLTPWQFEHRDIGPHDVQIEILYCGICHSDLHQVNNDWFPGIFPMVPGHEIVGRVTNVGGHVKKFTAGQLAAVGCMVTRARCGENCKVGLEQYCLEGNTLTYNSKGRDGLPTYGGYSNTIVVREEFVLHVSEKLPLAATAPLLCAGITTYSPLRYWKVGKGHKLAVLGLGGLGHMGVKFGWLRLGAGTLLFKHVAKKEKDALELGAHHFVGNNRPGSIGGR